jgi:hypothetical protein
VGVKIEGLKLKYDFHLIPRLKIYGNTTPFLANFKNVERILLPSVPR